MTQKNASTTHPEPLRRYRAAWQEWVQNPKLAEACRVLGMSEFEWAQRYVAQFGPITYSWSSTEPVWSFDSLLAWEQAKRPVAVTG